MKSISAEQELSELQAHLTELAAKTGLSRQDVASVGLYEAFKLMALACGPIETRKALVKLIDSLKGIETIH